MDLSYPFNDSGNRHIQSTNLNPAETFAETRIPQMGVA
jgi:hypothetical protein